MSGNARAKKIVAIDWDRRTLRLVHAFMTKRGPKIDRVLSVAIPKEVDIDNPEQMGLHIRRALEQEGISTKHAIVDIPRDQAILNTLNLPSGAPEDLPGMVEIQIAKELPFSVTDAVIDFAAPLAAAGMTTVDVLVAAVRREVLEQYEATVTAAGLKLERIGLRPYAHKVAVCDRLKHAMPERVLFIDVRPTLTEIDVLHGSLLAFSRSASVVIPESTAGGSRGSFSPVTDSGDVESPPPLTLLSGGVSRDAGSGRLGGVVQDLILEVTRSIEAYRANDAGAQIDLAVIGGDLGIEQELSDAIQSSLGINAELYNPASSFGWEPDEGAAASAYAATLGLVLAQQEDSSLDFDFLHPKKTVSVTKERLRRAPLVAAVVALFVCAGWVFLSQMTKPARAELATIQQNIERLASKERAGKRLIKFVDKIKDFDEQYVWVDVLDDVISVLPSNEELVVSNLTLNQEDGIVKLATKTKRLESASEIIRALEDFRRQGCKEARFKTGIGPQKSQPKDTYPYRQELRTAVLPDESAKEDSLRR